MKRALIVVITLIYILVATLGCATSIKGVADEETQLPSDGTIAGEGDDNQIVDAPSDEESEQTPEEPTPTIKYDVMVMSNVNNLNVRSGKGSGYSALGSINSGDMLSHVATEGGWYKVRYKRGYGYVSASYTQLKYMQMSDNQAVEDVLNVAKGLMGYPYVWGAQRYHWGNGILNPNFVQGQFDCSSLVQYVFYIGAGVVLDVNTRTQVYQGRTVSQLARGDVMFFTNADRVGLSGLDRVGHVAIYLGDNYILHTASDYAVIEPISNLRWSYFIVGKRMI
ncbi:MAG: C40 family peptidase [Christensenellales bacterium]